MTSPAFELSPYYVIATYSPDDHFVIGGKGSEREARALLRWMNNLNERESNERQVWYRIATWTNGKFCFLIGGSIDFPLTAFPYTRESYAMAMLAHGIDPKHMRSGIQQ